MTPAKQAKALGASSLTAVSAFSGYTLNTLRRYHRSKMVRFKALCIACACFESGLSVEQIKAASLLKV